MTEPTEPPAGDPPGNEEAPWYDDLSEDAYNETDIGILKRFGTVPDLAKGYLNAFNLVGRTKIPMPETDDEWGEVYTRLGRPETSDKYELSVNAELADPVKDQMEKNQDWFKLTAHELGLNQKQAASMYARYSDMVKDTMEVQAGETASRKVAAEEELKKEYGQAYDGKMTLANRAIEQLGGDALIQAVAESGLGLNPAMVKAFAKIGELFGEDIGLDKQGEPLATPDDLQQQIDELMQKPAYLNAQEASHRSVVARVTKLMQQLHPEMG